MIGFFGLQTLAIDHLPSGYASLLLYLQPVLTVLLAAPLLGDALTPARLVGALTAFVGVAVVSFHPDRTVTTTSGGGRYLRRGPGRGRPPEIGRTPDPYARS